MIYLEWYLWQSFKRFWMIIRKAGQIFDSSWQRLGKPFEHSSLFLITETRIFNAYKRFNTLVFLGPIQPISGFPFFGNVEATFSSFATLFFYYQKKNRIIIKVPKFSSRFLNLNIFFLEFELYFFYFLRSEKSSGAS